MLEVETVAKSKELKKALVQIAEGKTAQIVTNAKHCNPGMVVIVALVGAVVPVGADKDGPDTVIVQPANISGVKSEGM